MQAQQAVQKLLAESLTEIRMRQPAYSLRAFARRAGLSPSSLSEILNGKRRVSRDLASRISRNLGVDPDRARAVLERFSPKMGRRASGAARTEYTQVSMDQFRAISDWYHFAILSLSETQDYRHDSAWIAWRLGIGAREATGALERLERMGMLRAGADGGAVRGAPAYATSDEIADLSLRKAHAQNLELARASLERDAVAERDFTAITMAIDPARLPEAKKMIREFRDRLSVFLESGEKREVHKLCVQLIPLTRGEVR